MVPTTPAPDLAVRALQAARNRDHDAAALALELLHRDPFVHPAVGGAAFGYGPVHAYRLIKAGKIPSVRVGGLREGAQGRIRVPSAAALQLLGYPVQAVGATTPSQADHAGTVGTHSDAASDGAL